jgi:hypothetical protein
VIVPVKRRISKQIDGRITPTTLAAYQRALALREQGADPEEVHEAERVVDRCLGVRLWQVSVFDAHRWSDADERSLQLRQQLDAALAEAKRQQTAAA